MTDQAYRDIREVELETGGWSPSQRDNIIRKELAAHGAHERSADMTRRDEEFKEAQAESLQEEREVALRQLIVSTPSIIEILPSAKMSPDDFLDAMKEHKIGTLEEARAYLVDAIPSLSDEDFQAIDDEDLVEDDLPF